MKDILVGVLVPISGLLSVVITLWFNRNSEREARLFETKRDVYQRVLSYVYRNAKRIEQEKKEQKKVELSKEEIEEDLQVKQLMLLWCSAEIIADFNKLYNKETSQYDIYSDIYLDKIVRKMREELKLDNKKLGEYDLYKFIFSKGMSDKIIAKLEESKES